MYSTSALNSLCSARISKTYQFWNEIENLHDKYSKCLSITDTGRTMNLYNDIHNSLFLIHCQYLKNKIKFSEHIQYLIVQYNSLLKYFDFRSHILKLHNANVYMYRDILFSTSLISMFMFTKCFKEILIMIRNILMKHYPILYW